MRSITIGAVRPAWAPFTLGLTLAGALVLWVWPARAEPDPYELSYAAPPGCPSEAEMVSEVRANVHDAASGEGARIELAITRNGTGFTGQVIAFDRSGRQGRRAIQGPTCSEVGKTLAFLAALAIELGGRLETEPEAAPPAASSPIAKVAAPKSPAPRRRARSPAPPTAWKLSGLLGGGVRGALGPSPRPSAETGLELGAASEGRVLSPAVRATAVGSLSRISREEGTAKLAFLAGRLEGCPLRFGSRAVALRPCLGVELGAVFARGDLEGGRRVVQRWASAEAGFHLQTWLSPRVFLELDAAALVPFFRTRYFFVPDRIVYVVPALTGRATLAAGFRFR